MSKGRGAWSLENVGAPYKSYIKEKVRENRLGRSLTQRTNSRITTWGLFVEKLVFDKIGLDYKLESKTRFVHPDIPRWTGMPDVIKRDGSKVGDIKCPWTLTSFCDMAVFFQQHQSHTGHADAGGFSQPQLGMAVSGLAGWAGQADAGHDIAPAKPGQLVAHKEFVYGNGTLPACGIADMNGGLQGQQRRGRIRTWRGIGKIAANCRAVAGQRISKLSGGL